MIEGRNIWGIHMELGHGLRPVSEGFVAIGWDLVGDLSGLAENREAFRDAVAKAYPSSKPGAIPVYAGTLFKFLHDMKRGDLVIYPSKPDRMINIGRIESDYIHDRSSDHKFPNKRRVQWLKQLPRAHFSQAALNEIGSAVTLFQVANNADEFVAALKGEASDAIAVDETTAEATLENTADTAKDFVIKRLKSALGPYHFEEFIAHLLERMGYHTRVTQKSGDGGIDIFASKDELGFEPPIIKVQCKQTLNSIGQPDVAQLYGHIEAREYGLFVTLGEYTNQARQFERSKHNLRLINGSELSELVFSHYENFDPAYQMLLPLRRIYVAGVVKSVED